MSYTERELWIFILSVMHTSKLAQSMSRSTRQSIEIYLRDKLCPSITNEKWYEIETELVKQKFKIMKELAVGWMKASGKQDYSEEDRKLFEKMQENVKDDIKPDFEKIKAKAITKNLTIPKEVLSWIDDAQKYLEKKDNEGEKS